MPRHASVAADSYSIMTPAFFIGNRHMHMPTPLDILLVEDEASDTALTEMALEEANIGHRLHTLRSGQEVLPYLRQASRTPDMLLLDLSLPGKDGFEVLTELAEQSGRFADMPIVILTADARCAFLKQSYGLNIAAYLMKPCTPAKITAAIVASRRH